MHSLRTMPECLHSWCPPLRRRYRNTFSRLKKRRKHFDCHWSVFLYKLSEYCKRCSRLSPFNRHKKNLQCQFWCWYFSMGTYWVFFERRKPRRNNCYLPDNCKLHRKIRTFNYTCSNSNFFAVILSCRLCA